VNPKAREVSTSRAFLFLVKGDQTMIRFIEMILHPRGLRPQRHAAPPSIIPTATPASQAIRTATHAPLWGCLCRRSNPEA
jgi:hypothetical protein